MKRLYTVFLVIILHHFAYGQVFSYSSVPSEEELTLFNSKARAVAYIQLDEELTIYLWSGEPVAYLVNKDENYSIYGFNGKHLGWFIKGIIRDHDGNAVGFQKGAINIQTEYEAYKSYKQYKPYKSYKEYEPYMPYLNNNWSLVPLRLFLLNGISEN